MLKGAFAAAAASVFMCQQATAGLITIGYEGLVDTQYGVGSDPFTQVGDKLTINFAFDPATQLIDPFTESGDYWFPKNAPESSFSIKTSRGLVWLAGDEIHDLGVFLSLKSGTPTFTAYDFLRVSRDRPEIELFGNTFSIIGPDYTEDGIGFGGTFRLVDGIPEPDAWTLMIAGLGLAGVSARRRSGRPATPPRT